MNRIKKCIKNLLFDFFRDMIIFRSIGDYLCRLEGKVNIYLIIFVLLVY